MTGEFIEDIYEFWLSKIYFMVFILTCVCPKSL